MRELTLSFVASTNSAFSIVENKDFIKLVEYVSQTKANIPTTKTLMSDLNYKYEQLKNRLKEIIANANFLCLTADVWTKRSKSYLGVSIHFLDDQLNRQSYLLALKRIYGRHTHAVLAEMLFKIQKEFNIKRSKVTHIITDGGSNFRKAFIVYGPTETDNEQNPNFNDNMNSETIEPEEDVEIEDVLGPETEESTIYFPPETFAEVLNLDGFVEDDDDYECDDFSTLPKQMRCVAHSLNLLGTIDFEKCLKTSSSRCFTILTSGYAKLKRFWEVNSRSTVAHEIIQRVCKRSFPVPNNTRWNSKFDSIVVAEQYRLVIKEAIDAINDEVKKKTFETTKQIHWSNYQPLNGKYLRTTHLL